MNKKKKQHLINEEIKHSEVRVTDGGVMTIKEANELAISQEMDLVLINDKAVPVICKIMNYEKFIYELGKKPKVKTLEVKEVQLGANIADNDLAYRAKQIIEFLKKGHKVKLTLNFKGREITHVDIGKAQILKLVVAVEEHGTLEAMPNMEGKKMFAHLKPKTK